MTIKLIPIENETPYYHVIFSYMIGDASWFPVDSWNFREKNTYIACLSEALSIFNSNFQV